MSKTFGHRSNATINADRPHDHVAAGTEIGMGADQLIDELFSDLDLDLGELAPVADHHSLTRVRSAARVSADSALVPQSSRVEDDDLWVSYSPLNRSLGLSRDDHGLAPIEPDQEFPLGSSRSLLIAFGYISLVGLTMFWVGRQLRLQQTVASPALVTTAAQAAAVTPVQVRPADIEFAQYLSQSIKRRAA
ncbi:MAG: hypothetical protein HC792_04505 [Acaryochloridaceae cyanobacterium CSU_5_19]|nr:hypothetical protein [Acaryochloridaceae cyanobacterium CSU_5_19]